MDFIDPNLSFLNSNLNKPLDNAQRDREIKDLTDKSKSDLLGLTKLRKENPNNPNTVYLNTNCLREKKIYKSARNISRKVY